MNADLPVPLSGTSVDEARTFPWSSLSFLPSLSD